MLSKLLVCLTGMPGAGKSTIAEGLKSKGYELVITNVSPTTWSSFEDWWVHPDLIPRHTIDKIKNISDSVKKIDDYMLGEPIIKQKN